MLQFRRMFVILIISLKSQSTVCQSGQVWRIYLEQESNYKTLVDLLDGLEEADVWKEPSGNNQFIDVRIIGNDVKHIDAMLRRHDITHHVMIDDVKRLVKSHRIKRSADVTNRASISEFDYQVYHPANEIEDWMDGIVSEFPFVKKFQIGVSYEGRPISALKIAKSSSVKPVIYVDSLIHSREWIAGGATIYAFHQILSNPSLSWMTDDVDWIFLPMLNIDGYMHTWTAGNRLWRKTMSDQASLRCQGTDPNRNFDDHWSSRQGSSIEPCSSIFRGPFAHSEPETRHVANFIKTNRDVIKAVVTVHSYAQMVIYPYNYEIGQYPPNNDVQNDTAAEMSAAMYELYNTTYKYGPAAETLAVATGVTTDWTQAKAEIDINLTVELRDTGEYGFLLPEDQILPTGEELLSGLKVLVKKVTNLH